MGLTTRIWILLLFLLQLHNVNGWMELENRLKGYPPYMQYYMYIARHPDYDPHGNFHVGADQYGIGKGQDFDYLMFTMIHPVATCRADDDTVPGSCEIPEGTANWTIHGMWPNYSNGSYPEFCDHSKFDPKQIEGLKDQMRVKWPNLFPKTPEDSLWKHEWEKHGTCSKSDDQINTEEKYFGRSLTILDEIDLASRLEAKGIVPKNTPYDRDELQKSLEAIMEKKIQMNCLTDSKTRQSMLADIRICLNRGLEPIDCPLPGEDQLDEKAEEEGRNRKKEREDRHRTLNQFFKRVVRHPRHEMRRQNVYQERYPITREWDYWWHEREEIKDWMNPPSPGHRGHNPLPVPKKCPQHVWYVPKDFDFEDAMDKWTETVEKNGVRKEEWLSLDGGDEWSLFTDFTSYTLIVVAIVIGCLLVALFVVVKESRNKKIVVSTIVKNEEKKGDKYHEARYLI